MAVIKGKEKKLNKRIPTGKHKMSEKAKKVLQRRQDTQPVQAVAV